MTASLIFISAPMAAQAASTQYVTRGQYVEQLLQAVGIAPISNAQQTFTDVPTSNPYFGYVEAAYKAGITTGMSKTFFGVSDYLTRAEAAAFDLRAYSGELAYYAQTEAAWNQPPVVNPDMYESLGGGYSSGFSDGAQVPTALRGDVYIATTMGLLRGFPNGTFGPMQNLTSAQTADLVKQLNTVLAVSNSGPIEWRFMDGDQGGYSGITTPLSMQFAETAATHIGDVLAAIAQDKPFSTISQYVEPSDLTVVEQQFNQFEQQFQAQDVPAGIRWKVLGMSNGLTTNAKEYPTPFNDAAYLVEPMLDVQSINTATGSAVTLPTEPKSPNFGGGAPTSSVLSLSTPTGINTSGQIAYIGTNYRFYDMFVSPSQAQDPALSIVYGSGTTIGDQDLGSAIAVQGN